MSIRDRIRIGQRWQRRSRQKAERIVVIIYQVHAADHQVRVFEDGQDPNVPRTLFPINFSVLNKKYRLLEGE